MGSCVLPLMGATSDYKGLFCHSGNVISNSSGNFNGNAFGSSECFKVGSDGVTFTCTKAGTYTIEVGLNGYGTRNVTMYRNNTNVGNVGNTAPFVTKQTITFAVGDTLVVSASATSSSIVSFSYMLIY